MDVSGEVAGVGGVMGRDGKLAPQAGPGDELLARSRVYAFLARALMDEPDQSLLIAVDALPDSRAAAHRAGRWRRTGRGEVAQVVQEFHDLLKVPGPRFTTPYASVFLDQQRVRGKGKPLLFGPSTQEVARYHQAAALEIRDSRNEPVDHIGMECAFMAAVLSEAARAMNGGDVEEAGALCQIADRFVSEHLSRWADAWASKIEERAELDLFPRLADFLRGWLAEEAQAVVEPRRGSGET